MLLRGDVRNDRILPVMRRTNGHGTCENTTGRTDGIALTDTTSFVSQMHDQNRLPIQTASPAGVDGDFAVSISLF